MSLIQQCKYIGQSLLIIGLMTGSVLHAQDDVHLKVRSEGFRKINLAVAPLTAERASSLPEHLGNFIVQDLELSGFFTINTLNVNPDPKQLRDSRLAFSSILLTGSLTLQGSDISLTVDLLEIPSGQNFMHKTYTYNLKLIRSLGHEAADDIVLYLTGYSGISQTKIAYVKTLQEAKEIYLVDFDGYTPRQLTSNGSINISPTWSSDGKTLAFTSFYSGNPDLVLYDLETRKYRNISSRQELHSAPAWSPDGERIALTMTPDGNSDIYIMNTRGGNLQRLTHEFSIESSPSWSPDGREIVFTSGRSGSPQLYIMSSDGSNVRRLTYQGSYNESPDWSPGGREIAFVTRSGGGFQICTIDVNGDNVKQLTYSNGSNENPSWSPNGMWLTFASSRSGQWDIYVMNRDGGGMRQVTKDGGNVGPSWGPITRKK